jgi:CPA1 family monovalent cation:H+ antiporter
MDESQLLTLLFGVLSLLLLVCLTAIVLERFKFPYPIILALMGWGLERTIHPFETWVALPSEPSVAIFSHVLQFLFLPPLIFAVAQRLDLQLFCHYWFAIAVVAGPGLLLSAAIVGGFLSWLTPLSFLQACLLGAIIAATDSITVTPLFKELGISRRLTTLMEGESLLNNVTAIVTVQTLFIIGASGSLNEQGILQGLSSGLIALVGGLGIGLLAATILGYSITLTKHNSLIQGTLSALVAYGAFILAESLQVSGSVAVMSTGLLAGWINTCRLLPKMRNFLREFWDYGAFIANSLVFLWVGVTVADLGGDFTWDRSLLTAMGWTIGASLVIRGVVIYGLILLVNRVIPTPLTWRDQTVSFWGGVRGSVALLLALSLDPNAPFLGSQQAVFLVLTLTVVGFTIVAEELTLIPLLRSLKLDRLPLFDRLAQVETLLAAKSQALEKIQSLEKHPLFAQTSLISLRQIYEQAIQRNMLGAEQSIAALWVELQKNPTVIQQAVWFQAIQMEHRGYKDLYAEGFISSVLLDRLKLMTHLKLDAVRNGKIPPPQRLVAPSQSRLFAWINWFERVFVPHHPSAYRRQQQELQGRYIYDLAIAYVNGTVAQKMQTLSQEIRLWAGELSEAKRVEIPAFLAIFKDCIQAYQTFSRAAFVALSLETRRDPNIAVVQQRKMAHQAALLQERIVIEKLLTQGLISKTIAAQLMTELGLD